MEDYDGLDQPSTKSQNMRTTIPEYLRARLEGGGEEGEAQTGRQCRRRRPRPAGFFLEFPTISVLNASLFIR